MEKKNFFYLMLMMVMGLGLFTSCHDEEDPYLEIDVSEITVDAAGKTESFNIASNVSWTITGNEAWVDVTPSSGSGSKSINVKIAANKTPIELTCTLKVKSNDGKFTQPIVIKQNGLISNLSVNPATIKFGSSANEQNTFSIQCNMDWTISGVPEWLKVTPLNGNGNATVEVTTISANKSDQDKPATLTVTAGDKTAEVVITQQSGYAKLSVSVSNEIILSNGYYADLLFTSNERKGVLGYYENYYHESWEKTMTEQEMYEETLTKKNYSAEDANYTLVSGISPNENYIYCVIPYTSDDNGQTIYGPMKKIRFTSKSNSTYCDALISNVAYNSTQWRWSINMQRRCAKYYMLRYTGSTAYLLNTLYPDVLLAQFIDDAIRNYGLDYYIADNKTYYDSRKSDETDLLVFTWGVDDDKQFSGNISRGYIDTTESSNKNTKSKMDGELKRSRSELEKMKKEFKVYQIGK